MDEVRDNPGVIAPPPLIALGTVVLGLALDWFLPSLILRGIFGFWARLIVGAILMGTGAALAIVAFRSFSRAGTNVEPWKPALTLVTRGNFRLDEKSHVCRAGSDSRRNRYRVWVRLDACPAGPSRLNPAFRRGEARGALSGREVRRELSRLCAKSAAIWGESLTAKSLTVVCYCCAWASNVGSEHEGRVRLQRPRSTADFQYVT